MSRDEVFAVTRFLAWRTGLLLALALPLSAWAQQQTTPAAAATAGTPKSKVVELQAVVVSGEQPGPGLWKVSKHGHVLWVLGTLDFLPRQMQWQAREVRASLAQAQLVLDKPTVSVHSDTGFFGMLGLLPSLIGVRNNPDGKKLQEVVPPADYARWLALKAKHIGRDGGVEKRRPIFAAFELYFAAAKQAGLADDVIDPVLKDAMKPRKLKATPAQYTIEVKDAKALVNEFKRTPIDDLSCFHKMLDHVEGDIATMRLRANAWAVGDLDRLRQLPLGDQMSTCQAAVDVSAIAHEQGIVDLPAKVRAAWVAAAAKALDEQPVTFARLPMRDLLDTNDYLRGLQAQGATVEPPDGLTAAEAAPAAASSVR